MSLLVTREFSVWASRVVPGVLVNGSPGEKVSAPPSDGRWSLVIDVSDGVIRTKLVDIHVGRSEFVAVRLGGPCPVQLFCTCHVPRAIAGIGGYDLASAIAAPPHLHTKNCKVHQRRLRIWAVAAKWTDASGVGVWSVPLAPDAEDFVHATAVDVECDFMHHCEDDRNLLRAAFCEGEHE